MDHSIWIVTFEHLLSAQLEMTVWGDILRYELHPKSSTCDIRVADFPVSNYEIGNSRKKLQLCGWGSGELHWKRLFWLLFLMVRKHTSAPILKLTVTEVLKTQTFLEASYLKTLNTVFL